MKISPKHKPTNFARAEARQWLERLRQDQLEAALAGRIAESAFYAVEVQLLRQELAEQDALFLSA
jgi:predicted transcriptional regulator